MDGGTAAGTAAGLAERTGGRLVADALVAQGVTHVFSVPGESFLEVLDGLYEVRDRVSLVTCRFEAGAVHMAEAHGKLTGRPGVAMVTRGPGACHASIGVHVAMQDSTPLVLFVGQIPFAETDRDSFQEVDYRRMFAPLAKWVTQVDDPARVPELVARAFDVAVSGRPGPVVVALSEEMQQRTARVPDIGPRGAAMLRPHPAPGAVDRLMSMLARSERPLAILGGSGWTARGLADARRFLLANEIPVAVGFRRQGLYDGTLPNFAGDLGVGSDPWLVARAKEADLVLALGTRLGEAVTQGYTLFPATGGPKLVHVHPDEAEIGRVFRPALGVVSDLDAFAAALAARTPFATRRWAAGWTAALRARRLEQVEPPPVVGRLDLGRALRDLAAELPPDTIYTTDAGNFATWPTRFMHVPEGGAFLGPTNGAMGYGVPAAVGASLLRPGRAVVCFVGDGGFLMTGTEIATAVHHGATPLVLVFDNGMYGTIRMYQERAHPGRVSGTALTNPDFARLAESFGCHGEAVAATEEFLPAVRRARASGKAAVVWLRTEPEQITHRATISQLREGATPATTGA